MRRKSAPLGIFVLLVTACCLCCRAQFHVPGLHGSGGDWPMFGGSSAHKGFSDDQLQLPLQLQWRFRTKGPIVASPAISAGLLCFGSLDRRFYLLSAQDGQPYGSIKLKSSISASAAIGERMVFFGTEFGDDAVYALDLSTGVQSWRRSVEDVSASLTYAGGTVFVSSGLGSVHALSAKDGRELWRFQPGGRVGSSVAVWDGMAFFGCDDGLIYALNAGSGEEVWSRELSSAIWCSPVADGGLVYVGCFDGGFYSLRGKDGEVVWSRQMGGGVSRSPAMGQGMVYVGSDDGQLVALEADSGERKWAFPIENSIPGTPLVSGRLVFCGASDGCIYALDALTGEQKWSYKTGRGIVAAPASWEKRLFISSMDGYLYAFGQEMPDSTGNDQFIR